MFPSTRVPICDTMLGVPSLPPWCMEAQIKCWSVWLIGAEKKMVYDIRHGIPDGTTLWNLPELDQIFVTSVKTEKNQDAIRLNLIELGKLRGKIQYEATFDLLFEEEMR